MRIELQADASALAELRSRLRGSDELDDLSADVRADIVLIASELASNAIAASLRTFMIEVELTRNHSSLDVTVTNRGRAQFDASTATLPAAGMLRGRGLGLVRLMSSEVWSTSHLGITTVTARVALHARRG